jgi:hypothetical protein
MGSARFAAAFSQRQNSHTPDQKPWTAKRNRDGHPALCAVIWLAITVKLVIIHDELLRTAE